MRCGLYGKIPSKRDFINIAASRHFLSFWEPWLANCLAESRAMLGEEIWRRTFSEAPAWRFVLDSRLYGGSVFGAFTPSIDAIGRYFPLTLVAEEDAPARCATPQADDCQVWFDAAEQLLWSVLDDDLPREAIDAGLGKLSAMKPDRQAADLEPEAKSLQFARLDDVEAAVQTLEQIFAAGRTQIGAASVVNYWWTLGHETYKPRALVCKSMPDSALFAAMLGEQFANPARATSQSE
jgi:type VI secretion system protein ImpM